MDPLTIAGLAFTGATVASLVGLHLGKVVVPRVGKWPNPPRVLLQPAAPVALGQVHDAARFWADLGFKFARVELTDHLGPVDGAITIGAPDRDWLMNAAGRARWLTEFPLRDDEIDDNEPEHLTRASDVLGDITEGYITQAVIGIDPMLSDRHKVQALTHELGHALGFLHCETALLGRRKKDRKDGKRKEGEARRVLGVKVVGRKTGHVMHPYLSQAGKNAKGIKP